MALPVLQAFNEPNGIDYTAKRIFLRGFVKWTAQAYVAGGLLPSYSPINDASGSTVEIGTYPTTVSPAPDEMLVYSESGSGYVYVYIRSTGKIMIQTGAAAQSPLTELTAGSLPAGVTGDVVRFIASWPKA
jgi:hypothetical protein